MSLGLCDGELRHVALGMVGRIAVDYAFLCSLVHGGRVGNTGSAGRCGIALGRGLLKFLMKGLQPGRGSLVAVSLRAALRLALMADLVLAIVVFGRCKPARNSLVGHGVKGELDGYLRTRGRIGVCRPIVDGVFMLSSLGKASVRSAFSFC